MSEGVPPDLWTPVYVRVELSKPDSQGVVWRWTNILDENDVEVYAEQMREQGCTVSVASLRGRR